jgi:hypothetical protein
MQGPLKVRQRSDWRREPRTGLHRRASSPCGSCIRGTPDPESGHEYTAADHRGGSGQKAFPRRRGHDAAGTEGRQARRVPHPVLPSSDLSRMVRAATETAASSRPPGSYHHFSSDGAFVRH